MTKLKKLNFLLLILFFIPNAIFCEKFAFLNSEFDSDTIKKDSTFAYIRSLEEYVQRNPDHNSEKIYLHLDRNHFISGDTIWFKAYLWYGFDQIPDTMSGILYVDLCDSAFNKIDSRKLLIQNGTSYGEIPIDSAVYPGNYVILAYTRSMQNFEQLFSQDITIHKVSQNPVFDCFPSIIRLPGNDSIRLKIRFSEPSLRNAYKNEIKYKIKIGQYWDQNGSYLGSNSEQHVLGYSIDTINIKDTLTINLSINNDYFKFEKTFQIPLHDQIDVQFFPEGGYLINGLESRIAFKAIGTDGLGKEVMGEIETADGEFISSFQTTHSGMGSFMLRPMKEKQYCARFWVENLMYVVPLPPALRKGVTMSVSYPVNLNEPFVKLTQSPSDTITQKYIICNSNGKIWAAMQLKSFQNSCLVRIPIELIPEGICKVTVLNFDFQPECERLIFVNKNQRFNIEVFQDSSVYHNRSKVALLIKTIDSEGLPVSADLSLSVTDMEQTSDYKMMHGINAYKLLNSELQGYIEDADSYFTQDNPMNALNLDLVMLTHGYRSFRTVQENNKKDFEKSHVIAGKLFADGNRSKNRKLSPAEINLSIVSFEEIPFFDKTNADSLGHFRFEVPLSIGKIRYLIQAYQSNGKPFRGNIAIDEIENPDIVFKNRTVDKHSFYTTINYISRVQTLNRINEDNIELNELKTHLLEEVVVTAKAKNWWINREKYAIKIADLDCLDSSGNKYRDLNDLLVKEFGASKWSHITSSGIPLQTVMLPCIQFRELTEHGGIHNRYFPIFVIDDMIYWNGANWDFGPLNSLSAFPVNEISRIMVIPPMKPISEHYNSFFQQLDMHPSLVIIETYTKGYRGDPVGVKKITLDVLDSPRQFYSPRYDGPSKYNPGYDGRATLYWQPVIRSDANGFAKVEFYTSDRKTNFAIDIKGIDINNGNTGEGYAQISTKFPITFIHTEVQK